MRDRIFKLTMLVLIVLFLITIIGTTYAKYLTSRDSSAQARLAQWNIKLNNSDITENMDFSELINLNFESNPNIANNIIAPTSSGYFVAIIESTGTEVPFDYEFSVDTSESAVQDYRITSYLSFDASSYGNTLTNAEIEALKANTTSFVALDSAAATITGEVYPDVDGSGNYTGNTVKTGFLIYFGWYDGENEVLDNKGDVQASKTAHAVTPNQKGVIKLNLSVVQKDEDI